MEEAERKVEEAMTKLEIAPVFEPEQVLHDAQVDNAYDDVDSAALSASYGRAAIQQLHQVKRWPIFCKKYLPLSKSGALRALTSGWWPFGPHDFVLRAFVTQTV